jgi:hypothetical protein
VHDLEQTLPLSGQNEGDHRPPPANRATSVLEAGENAKRDPALELLDLIPTYYHLELQVDRLDQSRQQAGQNFADDQHFFGRKMDAFDRWVRSRRTRMDNETVLTLANIAWCFTCKCCSLPRALSMH